MKRTDNIFLFILPILLVIILEACSFSGFETNRITTSGQIDSALSLYVEREDITGFSVGVISHNQLIFTKGYGSRNVDSREPVTTRSLFHMASVSKPFVATAIMQLVEEEKISLDDRISSVLPFFKMADPEYLQITIGQMLSHLSGMPDVEDYEWDHPQYDDGSLKRYIRSLNREKLISEPGTAFHYSNMAYDILAGVIAEVSGMPFEDFVSERIFKPAGMTSSTFLKKQVPDSLSTTPHILDFEEYRMGVSPVYPYNRPHAGSSTLHSNAEDMIRWAFVNLYKGNGQGNRILKEESYDKLWEEKFQIGEERYIGLSWFISKYHGKTVISHSGGDTGFRSYLLLIPEDTTAIVAMGNSENFQSYGVAGMILDMIYDHPPEILRKPASFSFLSTWGEYGQDSAYRYFDFLKEHTDPTMDFDEGSLIMLAWPIYQ
ncbi:MAG: beta-lactamase family protein, partial [Cyclobacteriaceae bacterium]|nr:beta-lactamase family protein [Cyclobacteriaceae bacterium]